MAQRVRQLGCSWLGVYSYKAAFFSMSFPSGFTSQIHQPFVFLCFFWSGLLSGRVRPCWIMVGLWRLFSLFYGYTSLPVPSCRWHASQRGTGSFLSGPPPPQPRPPRESLSSSRRSSSPLLSTRCPAGQPPVNLRATCSGMLNNGSHTARQPSHQSLSLFLQLPQYRTTSSSPNTNITGLQYAAVKARRRRFLGPSLSGR